jgi:hypothetical protein
MAAPDALTETAVIDAFSVDPTNHRFKAVKYFLGAAHGLAFDSDHSRNHALGTAIERSIHATPSCWIKEELFRFYGRLWEVRQRRIEAGIKRAGVPMKLSTFGNVIRRARAFMEHCASTGASSALAIDQFMVDTYSVEHPRHFHSLGSFVRHLNRDKLRLFKLKLPPKTGERSSVHLRISANRRAELVGEWLGLHDGPDLRNSAVSLLCMFYLQKPEVVLALRRENMRREGEVISLDFGYGWEQIDPEICDVLARWLDAWHNPSRFRDIVQSQYLFPGMKPDKGYGSDRYSQWLRKHHGITRRQLYATAVHGLIEAGLTDPGALVHQFGIHPSSAIRYWKDSGRDLSSFLYAEIIQTMRERGEIAFE